MTDGNTVPAEAEPKTFSLDYVRELREENKGLRLARSNAERDRDGFKEAAAKAAGDARAEADRRVIRAELKARHTLPPAEAAAVGAQIADALAHAPGRTARCHPAQGR